MNDYRKMNTDYTEKNTIQQRQRNQKRQKTTPEKTAKMIVKSDAFEVETEKTTIYQMKILFPIKSEKIVKSDAFVVQLQKYQPEKSV